MLAPLVIACPAEPAAAHVDGTLPSAHAATVERLLERAVENAALICSDEWIEVYDLLHPEIKAASTIYQFLQGKGTHSYSEPAAPEVVAREGDTAYVSLSLVWTPRIDVKLDNVPPDWDPSQRIEWIGTWQFVDGDWHTRWPPQEPVEFFQDHPELLRRSVPVDQATGPSQPK